MVARITLDKIKGFCLKKPKDSKNDKNSSAQHYPGQGIKGIMKWTEGWADNPPPPKKNIKIHWNEAYRSFETKLCFKKSCI